MTLPDFTQNNILVIGDIMLDRYWMGSTSRISPEAPVPIVKVNETENRLGGAANVALNLSALGCKTSLFGMIGQDAAGEIIRELLDSTDIKHDLHTDPQSPTITKLRVMSQHQQLIRLDFEEQLQEVDTNLILAEIENEITRFNAVVISDYAKGTINDATPIIELCKENNIPVLIDPKGSDYTRYKGATALTPNRKELESVIGHQPSLEDLFTEAQGLCKKLDIQSLVVTLSEKGMALIQADAEPLQIPTQAKDVFDVTGAGDTVISTLAAAIAGNKDVENAMRLANTAAGIAVGKLGTATVSPAEIFEAINHKKTALETKIVSLEELKIKLDSSRQIGEKIVFTNGCFDILHAGHVQYLQEAATLGDKLIVAVNSDASIKKLKGPQRPINGLENRMKILASLHYIDWVISFDEDTPEKPIIDIKPDFLVKGGDYKAEELIGYNTVVENGGKVVIMPFQEGYSTTNIIGKLGLLK